MSRPRSSGTGPAGINRQGSYRQSRLSAQGPEPYVDYTASAFASRNRHNSDFENHHDQRDGIRQKNHSVTVKDDVQPYREYDQGELPPTLPIKRRRTGSSIMSAASTAWISAKEYAVSHFTVPRLAAPWDHEVSEKSEFPSEGESSTVREFDYRRQRRRLFVNSTFQWLMTVGLCAALAGNLYGFSTVTGGLTGLQKRAFNALITGLSIILGLNLASSLKGYAQMMRWRLLASGYRTLQDFELIMNCESQSKVFRLLWAGRTRGQWYPSKMQLLSFIWLIVNAALQVITALLGLTYSVDVSNSYVSQTYGNVSIADLSYIYSYKSDYSFGGQGITAHDFGIAGQDYTNETDTFDDISGSEQTYYQNEAMDLYWYKFIDRSATTWSESEVTQRTVTTKAICKSYKVIQGGYAGFDNINDTSITYIGDNGEKEYFFVDPTATGCTTWMSNQDTTGCGPRCTQIWALQSANNDSSGVLNPRFWQCNNTVGQVTNTNFYQNPSLYQMADQQARIMAGAIGWSGFTTDGDPLQYVLMPFESTWSPIGSVSELDMARIVMQYTAGAFAALDFQGQRVNVTGYYPIPAQVVDIQWNWAGLILGLIPAVQFLILLCVIVWANKAIIKDTSFLSTARLLRPVVDKLGDRGCLLTGDEIAEELGNYKITYGVRTPRRHADGISSSSIVRHLDIIDESEGLRRARRRMPPGRYDGNGLPPSPKYGEILKPEEHEKHSQNFKSARLKRRLSI